MIIYLFCIFNDFVIELKKNLNENKKKIIWEKFENVWGVNKKKCIMNVFFFFSKYYDWKKICNFLL